MNKKLFRLSIGSNVSLADYQMIEHTVPNWLRVFDNYLDEICLIIDPQKPTGRLCKQLISTQFKSFTIIKNFLVKFKSRFTLI